MSLDNQKSSVKPTGWQTRFHLAIIRSKFRVRFLTRKAGEIFESTAITASVILLGAIALFFTEPKIWAAPLGYGGILAQIAATAGTVVAIVFGLALAPVQRAAEALSPAILRVYARDRRIRGLFVALGLICVAVFLLSLEGIAQVPVMSAFSIGILLIAIALDLLRWFYKITLSMLNPLEAIQLAILEAKRDVHRMDKLATERAMHTHRLLPQDLVADTKASDWKSALLDGDVSYSRPIVYWFEEFSEIGKKASSTGQTRMALVSLQAITSVVCEYLSLRKDDLQTGADPAGLFLTSKSNVDVVIRPACENLLAVAEVAISVPDEGTVINVVQQLAYLALFQVNLKGSRYESWRGSLAVLPVGYIRQLFKASRDAKLQEVVFQGSGELRKLLGNLPASESSLELHTSLVDELSDNARFFYAAGSPALAEAVLAYLCEAIHAQYEQDVHKFETILTHVFRQLVNLSQIAVLSHATQPPSSMTSPLEGALSIFRTSALPYLLAKELAAAEVDPERQWVNPYHDFKRSFEEFCRTLRSIAEKCEFGATTMFLHTICEVIFYLGQVVAYRLKTPIDSTYNHEDELAKELAWLISPLWVAYDKKKIIDVHNAERCCDTAVAVGLFGLANGYADVAKTAASTARSISLNILRGNSGISLYTVADCLVRLEYLCLAAEYLGMSPFAQSLREQLNKQPEDIDEARWLEIKSAVAHRFRQFSEQREEYSYSPSSYMHAEGVLDEILKGSFLSD
ncbi:MAG: hypothetical protein ACOH1I_09780 [Gallionellaceae bacterium]